MPESMQFDETTLRMEARRRLTKGQLPSAPQQYLFAGAGHGQLCSLCDRPIHPQQIEYDLQFNRGSLTVCRFHRICHEAWELACIR